MKDIIVGTLVMIIIFSLIYRITLTRDFRLKQKCVEEIVYTYTQIASKKGCISEKLYKNLQNKLSYFGRFNIIIKVEKYMNSTNEVLKIVDNKNIINKDLRDSKIDLITLYVESKNRHPISILNKKDYKIKALSVAPVF